MYKLTKLDISILESIYLVYMFLFFKTSIDFNVLASLKGWLFEHLIGDTYNNTVCLFGRIAIFLLIFVLIMRDFINFPPVCPNLLGVAGFLSLINLNALVYLLPVILFECYSN